MNEPARADSPASRPGPDFLPAAGVLIGDRYRLVEKIGRGSSADVYRASDELLGRIVAVKLFRFDTDLTDRRRIDAEMRLLASLQHPGLVAVYDAGAVPGNDTEAAPYLVMELVDGPTLSHRLDTGPLGATDTAVLGAALAGALAYIHAAGIVHRDIKPANILLGASAGGDHAVKIADFGIARMVDGTRMTLDGLTIGTPNYLSPEQALGGDVGPPADIYALGLVLVQCLTGAVAYPGSGIEAALTRLHRQAEIPLRFGTDWAQLLTAMTARDALDRPTAAEVRHRLLAAPAAHEAVAEAATQQISAVPSADRESSTRLLAQPSTPGRPGRPWLVAAAAATVVLIALVGVLLISRRDNPASPPTPGPYPSVSGQLGRDLQQLQETVQ